MNFKSTKINSFIFANSQSPPNRWAGCSHLRKKVQKQKHKSRRKKYKNTFKKKKNTKNKNTKSSNFMQTYNQPPAQPRSNSLTQEDKNIPQDP